MSAVMRAGLKSKLHYLSRESPSKVCLFVAMAHTTWVPPAWAVDLRTALEKVAPEAASRLRACQLKVATDCSEIEQPITALQACVLETITSDCGFFCGLCATKESLNLS